MVEGRRNAATHPERRDVPRNPWDKLVYLLRREGLQLSQALRVERRLIQHKLSVSPDHVRVPKDQEAQRPTQVRGPQGRLKPGEPDVSDAVKPARGAQYTTTFNGYAGVESIPATLTSPEIMRRMQRDHPDKDHLDREFFTIPALLGRMKWDGIVPLAALIREVNERIQIRGRERSDTDFRNDYRHFSYHYQIIEHVGSNDRVVFEARDSRG